MKNNQHDGRITSGKTAISPSQGVINTKHVKITQPTQYTLFVGFEVNNSEAFKNDIHYRNIDHGHAFFYITAEYDVIFSSLSFGPGNGEGTTKHGDTHFKITGPTKLYKIPINKRQAEAIRLLVIEFKVAVELGTEKFSYFRNNTSAETARDILEEGGVSTPPGKSKVYTGTTIGAAIYDKLVECINPYKWESEFNKKYGNPIVCKSSIKIEVGDINPLEADKKYNKLFDNRPPGRGVPSEMFPPPIAK